LAYVLPGKDDKAVVCEIDLTGKPVTTMSLKAGGTELAEEGTRTKAVKEALPKGSKATYAETFYVANEGSERFGYVVPGITQGFKTFVKLMVSVNPKFTLTGVAITESEEDPGLGAEIQQDYFKNQFKGKTLSILSKLTVVKKPLPEDYKTVLEPSKPAYKKLEKQDPGKIKEIKEKHLKDDIYALTGATISSRAVTRGVKNTVKKFNYRFDILTKAIKEQKIPVAF
jgi:electron transport complex protein RnfG